MFSGAISGWNLFVIFEIGIVFVVLTYKLRKKFPARVNCWFCNTNTSVPYLLRNSWTCEKCDQYNGFSPDGGYNRDVPAQYCTKLNWSPIRGRRGGSVKSSALSSVQSSPSNGLCDTCNRNQCLKVQQLASFVPQNERTFNEEVEVYRKHLDEAYALCRDCEGVLRRQLNRVKRKVLGLKLTKAALILASKTPIVSTGDKNSSPLYSIATHTAVALGGLNFIRVCQNVKFSEILPALNLPALAIEYTESLFLHFAAVLSIFTAIGKYFISTLGLSGHLLTPLYAIFNPTNTPDADAALGDFFADISTLHLMGVAISLWILWQSDSGNQNKAIVMFLAWSASIIATHTAVALGGLNFIRVCQNVKFSEILPALNLPALAIEYTESLFLHFAAVLSIFTAIGKYFVSTLGFSGHLFTPLYAIFNPTNSPDADAALGDFFADISTFHLMGVAISLWLLWQSDSGNQNKAIVMFLAWSASMCDTFIEEKSLLIDGIFLILSAVIFIASFCNLNDSAGSSRNIVDMGKTFHRLYADCSDSEEDETTGDSEELERSTVMSRENGIKYPLRKFMANYHSASVSPKQQQQRSPESLNETSYHTVNGSFGRNFGEIDGRMSRNSVYSQRSPHRFGDCTLKPAHSQGNLSVLNDTFYSFDNRSQFSEMNSTLCDFRTVRALPTEEFNSAIGKLRIDDTAGGSGVMMPNASENLWQRTSPQPRVSNFILAHAKVSPKSGGQNSWVAGGFWSGSPVKKPLIRSHFLNTAAAPLEDFEQMETRSSSLSSGFESRPSSVHDTIGTQNNSRESSVCGDPEVTFAFSEPLPQRNFNCNGIGKVFNGSKKNDRPMPVFPIINSTTQTFIHPSKFDRN
uniref:Ima1 N-terminal domain-containing protein n=1 Tax=Lutzomyia longipalpis TaxID=7200 RepID=A0A1B0CII0_LUTLO